MRTYVREAKEAERQEARRLRAEGMSVRRIANELGVALSSVSVWVRDVPPPSPLPSLVTVATDRPAVEEPADEDLPARWCSRCSQLLPLAAFNRAGDGLQHWCRRCFRLYFAERGALHRTQVEAARRERRRRARAHVLEYLHTRRCVDCGEPDPLVLEFDHHRGEKLRAISELVAEAASTARIDRELALCEVVCASCHRRRTAHRGGWFRVTGRPRPTWTPGQLRNQQFLLDRLRASTCVDCAERDPVVLEFDHLHDKRAEVTKLAVSCGLDVLRAEVGKCVVRCANCHRRKTLRAVNAWRLGGADALTGPTDAPGRTRTSNSTLKRRAR